MLTEVAEYPNAFVDLAPGQERIDTGRYTLCLERSVYAATVQRQRFGAAELDDVIAEVRGLLRDRGRDRTQWEVGSGATPPGLTQMLLDRGLERDEDPVAVAVALRDAPPPAPAGLIVRPVADAEEFLAARTVQNVAFGAPTERNEENRRNLDRDWAAYAPRVMHAVWDGGRIIGAGSCAATPHALALFGGAVAQDARGRGAYRALIAGRWAHARSLRLPALVTQAGAMSRPILERLGFTAVGRVDMLVDRFT